MYAHPDVATIPGTLTNVTPEMAAPMVDMATSSQLLLRLPEKKPALSALRPARYEMKKSSAK
jgi:hypothetical protein